MLATRKIVAKYAVVSFGGIGIKIRLNATFHAITRQVVTKSFEKTSNWSMFFRFVGLPEVEWAQRNGESEEMRQRGILHDQALVCDISILISAERENRNATQTLEIILDFFRRCGGFVDSEYKIVNECTNLMTGDADTSQSIGGFGTGIPPCTLPTVI